MENHTPTQRIEIWNLTFVFIRGILPQNYKCVVFLGFMKYNREITEVLLLSFCQWDWDLTFLGVLIVARYIPRLRQHRSHTFHVILSMAKMEGSEAGEDNMFLWQDGTGTQHFSLVLLTLHIQNEEDKLWTF